MTETFETIEELFAASTLQETETEETPTKTRAQRRAAAKTAIKRRKAKLIAAPKQYTPSNPRHFARVAKSGNRERRSAYQYDYQGRIKDARRCPIDLHDLHDLHEEEEEPSDQDRYLENYQAWKDEQNHREWLISQGREAEIEKSKEELFWEENQERFDSLIQQAAEILDQGFQLQDQHDDWGWSGEASRNAHNAAHRLLGEAPTFSDWCPLCGG